jgi:hypothetical protein
MCKCELRQGRVLRAILLAIAAVAVVIVAAGCGGSDEEATATATSAPTTTAPTTTAPTTTVAVEFRDGDLLFADDFSDTTAGWGSDVVADGEYGYAEGAYRILVKPATRQLSRHLQGKRLEGARAEIQATLVAGTNGDALGILCYTDLASDEGYMLAIFPADQGHALYAFRGDSYQLLEGGDEPIEGIRPVGEDNHLEVQCAHVPDGPNFLTLAVNGQELAQAFDERQTRGFDAFGMVVDTTEGGAEGRFDDFVATELLSN